MRVGLAHKRQQRNSNSNGNNNYSNNYIIILNSKNTNNNNYYFIIINNTTTAEATTLEITTKLITATIAVTAARRIGISNKKDHQRQHYDNSNSLYKRLVRLSFTVVDSELLGLF